MNAAAREWGGRILALLASVALCLVGIEILLRLAPGIFGMEIANSVFGRYGTAPGDIYFADTESGMKFMHPDFQTRAFHNGYFWDHATDRRGFRNPQDRPVNGLLLLGDSLIYGHGVDEEQSVAHFLETAHGRSVYNLSRQGDSLYQHYVNLRLHLEEFEPEAVVLFVFYNDFRDLEQYRSTEQIERAPEVDRYDYEGIRSRVQERGVDEVPCLRRLRYRTASYRLFKRVRRMLSRAARGEPDPPSGPEIFTAPLLDPERLVRIARYYDLVLGDLAERSRAVGADLLLVYLDLPLDETAKSRAREMLERVTTRHGIRFLDTGDLFLHCEGCLLANDGHFTEEGHRRLAAFVHGALGRSATGTRKGEADGGGGSRPVHGSAAQPSGSARQASHPSSGPGFRPRGRSASARTER
jgi:hypothetical protein